MKIFEKQIARDLEQVLTPHVLHLMAIKAHPTGFQLIALQSMRMWMKPPVSIGTQPWMPKVATPGTYGPENIPLKKDLNCIEFPPRL